MQREIKKYLFDIQGCIEKTMKFYRQAPNICKF
ncbi:MAG: hypothetical protein JWR54_2959 [Mucilaginibacter sp.]|nr:hypothetical protein [Mucilaginibacter sp.]